MTCSKRQVPLVGAGCPLQHTNLQQRPELTSQVLLFLSFLVRPGGYTTGWHLHFKGIYSTIVNHRPQSQFWQNGGFQEQACHMRLVQRTQHYFTNTADHSTSSPCA